MLPRTKKPNEEASFFLLLLTAIAAFRIIWIQPLSVDSYTHIAIGEHILQTGAIPSHDDLSYKLTDPSLEWISHSWMADVLLYMGQNISLKAGIILILLPLLTLSGYLGHLLIPQPRLTLQNMLCISVTIIITAGFWRYHPFVFMVPLHLALMVLIKKWYEGGRLSVWLIPIVFLLWANIAGGYIVIPALYCLIAGGATFLKQRLEKSDSTLNVRAFNIAVLVGILLTLLNPYGARIWMYWLTVVAIVYQNRSFSSLIGALATYNQTSTHQTYSSLYLTLFTMYSGVVSIWTISSLITSGRTTLIRSIPYLPHVLVMMLGYFWVRFIPLSVFTLMPLAASSQTLLPKMRPQLFAGLVGLYTLLLCSIIIVPPNTPAPRTPIAITKVIHDINAPENILTTYDNTGYVMYTNPEYKVLLDAQDDLIDDGSLITNYQPVGNFTTAFKNISSAQGIHTAIISRDVSGLSQTLSADESWALIYFDDTGAIFIDRNAISKNTLSKLELSYVDLEKNLGFSADMATQSARELEGFIKRYPENYFAIGQLATVYRMLNAYNRAYLLLQSIPKRAWTFATYTELGRLEAALGKCKSAEDAFQTALTHRNEKNYSRTVLDIAVLYAGCLGDKKKAKHFFQRYNSFLVTTNEREKLNALTKQFGIDFTD